jgi:hypothetical protein
MARARKAAEAAEGREADLSERPRPEKRKVTERQAAYLAEVTGSPHAELVGRAIGDLPEAIGSKIDPTLLLFRRVCGRVVKLNPVTGELEGVPNATVHVEDTDCSFLGFFPVEGPWIPWWWFWPLFCQREEIATVVTDSCGRFCVSIPRWDIDRILRFRLERVCFPEIYRPTIRDLLDFLKPRPIPPIPPGPGPDPPPFAGLDRELLEQAGGLFGRTSLERLTQLGEPRRFGEQVRGLNTLLDEPAFVEPIPPPLDDEALKRIEDLDLGERLSDRYEKAPKFDLAELRPIEAIGPFIRCRDVLVSEWEYFFDVPDITFRVTQDVDFDGDEEEIYSEAFFDVRWNAGAIPSPTLKASAIARSSPICEGPDPLPCGNQPAIVTVGLMPLAATHHDNGTGHAIRVNRPRLGGLFSGTPQNPGQAPYAGTLQLHGCHHIAGAVYYRLLYSYQGGTEVPFLGLEWYPPKLTGPPWWFHAVPDGAGWYEVLPEAQLVFPHWLLNWPTTASAFPNGQYDVRLELADAGKTQLAGPAGLSPQVRFTIDKTVPSAGFSQLRWRQVGASTFPPQNVFNWPFVCIVVRRPAGADIELELDWSAGAVHFRSASLSATGCGGGNPTPVGAQSTREHWHENAGDNSFNRTAQYTLPGTLPQGSYSFSIDAYTRAFNAAGDGGGPATNWFADYGYIRVNPGFSISVINL